MEKEWEKLSKVVLRDREHVDKASPVMSFEDWAGNMKMETRSFHRLAVAQLSLRWVLRIQAITGWKILETARNKRIRIGAGRWMPERSG